jgi:hypothetical protein
MTKEEFKQAIRELAGEALVRVTVTVLAGAALWWLFEYARIAIWWLFEHVSVAMLNSTLSFLGSAFSFLAAALLAAFYVSIPFLVFSQIIPRLRSKNSPALTREERLIGLVLAWAFLAAFLIGSIWWLISR